MNILLISASPHKTKSRTFLLAKEVLKGLPKSARVRTLHLSDTKIGFCRHCEACHRKIMNCPVKDDVRAVMEAMLTAGGIIFATPNYINQVTAQLKALWDRTAHFIHCRRLEGKYIAGVVTSGSGRNASVLEYIRHYARACGAQYMGGISSQRQAPAPEKKKEAKLLGKKLAQDIAERMTYPEEARFLEEFKQHFRRIMQLRKNEWTEEYRFWQEKGWLQAHAGK
ncbi:MAG: NAD(P)H-dependent oxidoreductase [Candidatus Omnitrophica bacterium]|nr:NAD(P)H-dependent oxidoreductase [Candidatus Omnitrophota bacterium]